jgi:hypothetical protein
VVRIENLVTLLFEIVSMQVSLPETLVAWILHFQLVVDLNRDKKARIYRNKIILFDGMKSAKRILFFSVTANVISPVHNRIGILRPPRLSS